MQRIKSKRPMIIASDDPRVLEYAKSMPGVLDVSFIEKMESFWIIQSDVKSVIRKIDEWLCSLNPEMPKEVMGWGNQIEGGLTSQRVQDVLLLIRSYLALFSDFDVTEVHTIAEPSSGWEDDVLRVCAEAKALPFKRHIIGRVSIWKSTLNRRLLPFAKAAYFLLHEAFLGGGRLWSGKAEIDLDGAIVFQLCGSLRKHVDNVRYIMSALAEQGQRAVALCWSASGRIVRPTGVEQLTESGIPTIGLERLVTLGNMLASLLQAGVIFMKGRSRLRRLASLSYGNVPLVALLEESFSYFFVTMLPQRIRYAKALHTCLLNAKPVAIKPWGGADFFEGKLALRLLHNGEDPMYVHYWVGAGIQEWPYTDLTYKPDIFLAKSPFEAELAMREYEIEESRIEVVGQARYENLHLFSVLNTAEKSRRLLNLPLGGNLYIGVDPGGVLRAYQSYREQLKLITSVLNAAQELPNLIVVVKAHPSYGIEHIFPLIESFNKFNNVVVLPKTAPVDHFLNAIDIIITKFSTLILEAALMERCAISFILDGEERFKIFGNLPQILENPDELATLIMRLASDQKVFADWKAERLFHQERLLPTYYFRCESPASVAAERIIRDLRWL